MTKKLKHLLPTYSLLEHLCLDSETLSQLVACTAELENDFRSPLEVNKKLCSVHHDLTHSSYNSFFQISLTDTAVMNESITINELDNLHETLNASSLTNNIRLKKHLGTDINSPLNEATFTSKTETYRKYSAIFDKVLGKFRGTPSRIRLLKLQTGSSITPHIDYDPSYAVRVIIPIIAEPECVNLFWVKNEVQAVSLKPGNAYFLNTGYKHAVVNYGNKDRYTFMISLSDTTDIQHLL